MRYELYSLNKAENICYYRFEKTSDNIDVLLKYVLNKQLNCPQKHLMRWIYLDNQPEEYNILTLGYTKTPTENECRQRIFECKFQKHLSALEINNFEDYDFDAYSKDYERITKTANTECDDLCTKLFTYKPITHINIFGAFKK